MPKRKLQVGGRVEVTVWKDQLGVTQDMLPATVVSVHKFHYWWHEVKFDYSGHTQFFVRKSLTYLKPVPNQKG